MDVLEEESVYDVIIAMVEAYLPSGNMVNGGGVGNGSALVRMWYDDPVLVTEEELERVAVSFAINLSIYTTEERDRLFGEGSIFDEPRWRMEGDEGLSDFEDWELN